MGRKFYSSLFCLVAFSAASYGNIILQDNFDAYATGTFNNLSTLGTNWTVNGSVDVVGGGFFGGLVVPNESGNAVDLDGTGQGGLTSLVISFAPGNYVLTFDLNGSQRGPSTSTTITLGSLINVTIPQNSADASVQTFNFTVASATNASLVFTSNTPGNVGSLLDNVLIQDAPAVPEPSTFGFMLSAAPLLWIARKRYARR